MPLHWRTTGRATPRRGRCSTSRGTPAAPARGGKPFRSDAKLSPRALTADRPHATAQQGRCVHKYRLSAQIEPASDCRAGHAPARNPHPGLPLSIRDLNGCRIRLGAWQGGGWGKSCGGPVSCRRAGRTGQRSGRMPWGPVSFYKVFSRPKLRDDRGSQKGLAATRLSYWAILAGYVFLALPPACPRRAAAGRHRGQGRPDR